MPSRYRVVAGRLPHGVAAELLQARLGQHQRDHGLGHHAGRRDCAYIGALVDRRGRLVRGESTVSSERGTVQIGFMAASPAAPTGRHAPLGTAGAAGRRRIAPVGHAPSRRGPASPGGGPW